MALSKAMRPGKLFTLTASGTDDLASTTAFLSAVNTGSITGGGPQIQWKVKELLFSRSLTGSIDITMSLKDKAGKVFTMAEILGFTTTSARIAATLSSGEFLFDSDAELYVTSANIGSSETWNLRVTCQVVG